jgi:hypothetical protein
MALKKNKLVVIEDLDSLVKKHGKSKVLNMLVDINKPVKKKTKKK